ncbi:MAG: bifunctional phosphoglucose/phosphomannose isomerase [Candidatus Methanomethylophilaceae archaeon]|jgi:glucose/mannose-6-phosphate isomerase|nr:bifunctional phosphoglucose/phosphomannose isomerase [Candidatus Methanomethylophilaceae archaeon]
MDCSGGIEDSKMYMQVKGLPEQIEEALDAEIGEVRRTRNICIFGMGASSLAGSILSDYADSTADMPIPVIRSTELPKWLDGETTVIAVSYSGNTREILCVYDEARSRGCNIISITSGGALLERCASHGMKVIKVPEGLVSRGALGCLIGYLGALLEDMGVCNSREELRRMLPKLKEQRDLLISEENNLARNMAQRMADSIPVIYSLSNMRSAAVRWKTQFNENCKMIAFNGSIPEFNHNEIIGWTEDNFNNDNFIPVILYDETASDLLRTMTDTSIGLLKEGNQDVLEYHVGGSSSLEKNIKCIILGDFVSLYMAKIRCADPSNDEGVESIKEGLDLDEERGLAHQG